MNPIVATSLAALTTTQVQPVIEWLLTLLGLTPPAAVAAGISALAVSGVHLALQTFQVAPSSVPAADPPSGPSNPPIPPAVMADPSQGAQQ